MEVLLGAIIALVQVLNVESHGRLMDPPARNSMWRFGFPNPVNYNDNELFCGGWAGEILFCNSNLSVLSFHKRHPHDSYFLLGIVQLRYF